MRGSGSGGLGREVYEGFGRGFDVHTFSVYIACQYCFLIFILDTKESLFAIAFRRAEFFLYVEIIEASLSWYRDCNATKV